MHDTQRPIHQTQTISPFQIKYGLVGFEPTDILNLADQQQKKRRRSGHDDSKDSDSEPPGKRKRPAIDDDVPKRKKEKRNRPDKQDPTSSKPEKGKGEKKVKKALEKKLLKKRQKQEDDVDPLYMRGKVPWVGVPSESRYSPIDSSAISVFKMHFLSHQLVAYWTCSRISFLFRSDSIRRSRGRTASSDRTTEKGQEVATAKSRLERLAVEEEAGDGADFWCGQ